jgi:hypothetical protein
MSDLLWLLGAVVVCGGLFLLASRIEPHWVAKDGSRFLTTAQPIDRSGHNIGRKREVRVAFLNDGDLLVSRRSIVRTATGVWRIQARSPQPPRGRQVYLLRELPPDPDGELLAIRVPAGSRVVPMLDQLSPDVIPNDPRVVSVPTLDPGTRRWGRRADRG